MFLSNEQQFSTMYNTSVTGVRIQGAAEKSSPPKFFAVFSATV